MKRENKWISTVKTGVGTNHRKRETNGLVQVKTGVGRPILGKEKTNGLEQVKTGLGDQPKEKRKQMDKYR